MSIGFLAQLILVGSISLLVLLFFKDFGLWQLARLTEPRIRFSEIRAFRKRNKEPQIILEGYLMLRKIELNAELIEVERLYAESPENFKKNIEEEIQEAIRTDGKGKRWKWVEPNRGSE